jgi:hypothetical protein
VKLPDWNWLPSHRATHEDVRNTVGDRFYIDRQEMSRLLGCEPAEESPLRYSRRALRLLPKQGKYVFLAKLAFSPRYLYEHFKDEFCPSPVWKSDAPWLDDVGTVDDLLIDLQPRYIGTAEAFKPISRASGFSRLKPSTVLQLLLAFRLRSKIRLLSSKLHVSYAQNPDGTCCKGIPFVGQYTKKGILVDTLDEWVELSAGLPKFGVMVCKLPDKK